MKNLWSVAARKSHYDGHEVSNKSGESQQRIPRQASGFLWGITAPALLFISGCNLDEPHPEPPEELLSETASQQQAAAVQENIQNSYANLAAQRSDVCPKLIQQRIDSNTIERTAEVMTGDYCDYFFYPRVGEHIELTLDNDQLEALLIIPTLHNFSNGGYEVISYDKHVVRLSYDGASYKPENFSYDVTISVTE